MSGLGSVDSEPVDPDDDVLARLDAPAPPGVRGHELGLHVATLDGRHRAAHRLDPVDLGPRALDSSATFAATTREPSKRSSCSSRSDS